MFGIIGHAAIDIIRRGSRVLRSPGGAPTYCSFYLKQINIEVVPISIVGIDFNDYLMEYASRGINTSKIRIDNTHTTSYEITYLDDSHRKLRLVARCRDFTREDLDDLPNVVAVNPIAGEISLDVLNYVRSRVNFLGVDIQGFTRMFDSEGYVKTVMNLNNVALILRNADIIKISIDDTQIEGIQTLADRHRDKVIVISMGAQGSMMIHNGKVLRLSTSGIVDAKDPTGAGDVLTCMMTYLLSKGEDLVWSFIYSNAVAAAKTISEGPYGSISRELLESIMSRLYLRLVKS
ncbi:MAG: PfkB family carbohydrate kinase [Vulcanisaeta sp. AZ3]|jgi:sugar/nucleoside kinase (ribokinase family)